MKKSNHYSGHYSGIAMDIRLIPRRFTSSRCLIIERKRTRNTIPNFDEFYSSYMASDIARTIAYQNI